MIPTVATPLFLAFKQAGEELWLVGGSVRDYVLKQLRDQDTRDFQPKDLDFATSAKPERTKQILEAAGFPVYPIGVEFGTIGSKLAQFDVEITTYRCKESYTKGSRKPQVVFGKTLAEDLKRRDFTVNAMAMNAAGVVYDPFWGRSSALRGALLTPSEDPADIFEDDPLRMLRAFRFEAQLGLKMCGMEFRAIQHLKAEIHNISSERIFAEMSKLLMCEKPGPTLKRMGDSGLLGEIFPEVQVMIDFKQNQGRWHSKLVWPHVMDVVDNSPAILPVRWAALFHDIAKPMTYSETETGVHFYEHEPKGSYIWNDIADRLKVSGEFKREVYYLIHHHLRISNLCSVFPKRVSKSALRRFIRDCGDYLDNLYYLSVADITSHHPDVVKEKKENARQLKEALNEIIAECDVRKLKLPKGAGAEIAEALNLPYGPKLGGIMRRLNDALVAGELFDKPFDLECDYIAAARMLQRGNDEKGSPR